MAESLKAKIEDALKQAMKEQAAQKLGVLRMLAAAIHNREIEKKAKSGQYDLTDEEVLGVVEREAKKRKEAIELYNQGGRPELAKQESEELAFLQVYLPAQMSEAEVKKIVAAVVKNAGAVTQKDFGKVMGEAMKQLKGKADAKLVQDLLKEALAAGQ